MAGYPGQFGNVLIKKESFDKFINTMVGVPVIINHKDLSKDNADGERVGVVSNVWFDDKDGWYWCDGIIWDETAQNLITDKGWSVSCSYDVKLADDAGGTENNIPYDIEFLDGVFTHLAIVDNPRYERANIVFNSKTVISQFKEEDHPRDENGRFTNGSNGVNPNYKEELKQVIVKAKNNPTEHQKLVIGKVSKDLEDKARANGFDISDYQHDLDVSGTRHAIKEHGQAKTEEPRGQIAITDEDFEKIPEVIYSYDEVSFTGKNKIGRETITYKKSFDDGTIMYVEEIRDKRKTLTINTMYKYKNTGNPRTFVDNNNPLSNASIYIITDNNEDFNPDIKKNVQNNKENTEMALIDELKKLITKVENNKPEGENMDKKQRIMNILNSADVDEDVKKEVENELDKEDEKPDEKAKNEKEDEPKKEDDKADNKKVKNEEPKEDKEENKELKEGVKKDVQNKCKNSVENSNPDYFAHMNKIYNSAMVEPKELKTYVSRAERLEAGNKY